jgi:hypothetical protein
LPGLADPQRAPAGYRTIPALVDGGHLGENALAVGQPRDAQAITESGGHSRAPPHARGITEAALIEAAGGDLNVYILAKVNRVVDEDRVARDKL